MKKIQHIVFAISMLISSVSLAQVDTVFWFAAPWVTPDHDQNTPMAFHISTFNNPTTVRIHQPASVYDTTFTVPANALFSKYVSHIVDSLESKPADSVINSGFQITADFPIVVVYDFISEPPNSNNPETYSLKGDNGLGTEFFTSFQTLWNNRTLTQDRNGDGIITQPYQMFSVVASEDSTTIYITPRCNVVGGHAANQTYSVFLPKKGNVYTCQNAVQNTSDPGNSLAGSIVVSDKPVGVTVSDDSVNPSGGGGCFDLMGDQIVPVDVIGKEYIVNKGFLNAGSNESAFILATENFTTITIDNGLGVTTAILNKGETYQYSITEQLTYIEADKNVYVLHMSGYGCELGKAILPPLNCAGSDQVSFPRTNDESFLLDILCPAGAEGNFILNGSPFMVTAADFSPVPGTGGAWMGAQVDIPTDSIASGTSNFMTNTSDLFSLGIINGSAAGGCLYHYLSLFNRKVLVDAGAEQTLCSENTTVNLTGSVEGGTITGEWQILNGTGTLNNPTNLTTTYDATSSDISQGVLTFVLGSTGNCDPVYDTLQVNFIQSPTVSAGGDASYCKNNLASVPLTGSVQFAVGATWTGGSGGAFANAGNLNTSYTPSQTDISNDSVNLFLTSGGSLFSCPNRTDTVTIFFTDAPSVVAGANQVICSSITEVTLNGSVTGPTSTGLWTTTGSGSFSPSDTDLNADYNVTPSDTTTGNVWMYLTSTNNANCVAVTDSLEITILDKPFVEIASDDSICANLNSFPLTGTTTAGYSVNWTVLGSGNVLNPNSANTTYIISPLDTAQGYVDIILQTSGGLCPVEQDSLRAIFIVPPKAFAGIDQQFCDNENIQLNGQINGGNPSGTWTSTGTGIFTPSNNLLSTVYQPSALDVSNGGLNLILSTVDNFGCPADEDTLVVTFKEVPNADFSNSTACSGSNTFFTDLSTLNGGNVVSWFWDFGDNTNSIADDPIHPFPGPGDYTVSLVAGGSNNCFDTVVKTITVNPTPNPDFNFGPACEGQNITFQSQSFISGGSIISYFYDFGDGIGTGVDSIANYTFNAVGSYNVSLTVNSDLGCSGTYTELISVLPGPDADFTVTPNPALALEDVNFFDNTTGATIATWVWNFGDGQGSNVQNPTISYDEGGGYTTTLFVTDVNGCTDSTSREILVALLPVLPTAFTPNGDGENDIFLIRGGPFTAVDFKVYNNWGELIWMNTNLYDGWDGNYQGEPAQLGVYTWTFEVTMPGGNVIRKSGDVTLIR